MSDPVRPKSLTPILVVDEIGPCLPFWERIGFSVANTVPDGPPFGLAILMRDGIEVMLQTRQSMRGDTGGVVDRVSASLLYLSVAALDPVLAALPDAPVAVPRRRTFYGADEIFLLDPAGNVIGFAAQATSRRRDYGRVRLQPTIRHDSSAHPHHTPRSPRSAPARTAKFNPCPCGPDSRAHNNAVATKPRVARLKNSHSIGW